MGTRHVDPDSGYTYETTEIKVTPNQDIVAWRKRFYNGKLDKNSQGPFFAENICEYTQQTMTRENFVSGSEGVMESRNMTPGFEVGIDYYGPICNVTLGNSNTCLTTEKYVF